MKIQCDVCERAAAAVLCFADEATLCWSCDEKVHAANKVAGKHRRVLLLPTSSSSTSSDPTSSSSSADIPACDVCKEKAGHFFCLEDRALLCRQCDATTHAAKPCGSSHQRFLITGVRVDDDAIGSGSGGSSRCKANSSSSSGIHSPWGSLASTPTAAVGERLQGDPTSHDGWSWSELLDGVELESWHGGIPDPGSSSTSPALETIQHQNEGNK